MDAAPRRFADLPTDPELGVPVPFAAGTDVGYGDRPNGSTLSVRELDKRRVTQCALSRVCGVCGAGLGRPLAFVGSQRDADRLAYRFPACHVDCAEALLAAYADVAEPVLGLDAAPADWLVVTTASFELVRPSTEDVDRRLSFQPNGVFTTARPG